VIVAMNSSSPMVSVIIPTFNQAEFLQKALQSVINQTFQDWEAIVIDNHSQDTTKEIVESMKDSRIRYVGFSNNGIIAASRNLGINIANGNYIAFLDSDDLWYPLKLSTCLDYLNRGADAACHGTWIRKDLVLGKKFIPAKPYHNLYETLLFKGNSIIVTSTVIVKKQCLKQFGVFSENPAMVMAEDYDLWLRLAKNNVRWIIIPEILGEYTVHGKNASNNIKKHMMAEEAVVMNQFTQRNSHSLYDQLIIRKSRMMIALRAGRRVQQTGQFIGSIPYIIRGLSIFFLGFFNNDSIHTNKQYDN
jgi:glycosyltransferase involved in cell wall biosynthesis